MERGRSGGGEVEKEEREEEKMEEEEERWCLRDRRGKRGEVEQRKRGAETVAPFALPGPNPGLHLCCDPAPRSPVAWHLGFWMKAGCVHVW